MKNLVNTCFLVTIVIISCFISTRSSAQDIIGTWTFDDLIVTMKEDAVEAQKINFESQRDFTITLREFMRTAKVSLKFNDDGSMESSSDDDQGNPQKETSTWKIEGDKLFWPADQKDGDKYKVEEGKLIIIQEDSGTIKTYVYIAR